MRTAQSPLFTDPIYGGAADPVVFWHHQEKQWWMVYTQRMHSAPGMGYAPVHGSALGMASSPDGHDWLYRGTLNGLAFEPGHNTFWAPEILRHEGRYHMYVSYVQGIPTTWNRPRDIIHYTSENGWDWQMESKLALSSGRVIDACVAQLPNGVFRMWYKDEGNHSHTWCTDSADLYHWKVVGPAIEGDGHEGPNVFYFKNAWWLIADYWQGQKVFKSHDCQSWQETGLILNVSGSRPMDQGVGNHADVLVVGEEAYVFYFASEPVEAPKEDAVCRRFPRTAVQVARLKVQDETLLCDRDEVFEFHLPALTLCQD